MIKNKKKGLANSCASSRGYTRRPSVNQYYWV